MGVRQVKHCGRFIRGLGDPEGAASASLLPGLEMAKATYLFVISPRCLDLYADLAREFGEDPGIEVILDRRTGERRTATVPLPAGRGERRRRDRRINPPSRHDLAALGYVLVRVDGS